MQRITERLNRSRTLGGLIAFFSRYLANYRGIPILAGILGVLISLVFQLVGIAFEIRGLLVGGVVVLHCALLVALIGVLLAEPLGKG